MASVGYHILRLLVNLKQASENAFARNSDLYLADLRAFQTYNYDVAKFILRDFPEIGEAPGARILDWGCGDGGKTVWYQERIRADLIVGLDVQDQKLSLAREFAMMKGASNCFFLKADGKFLPFPDSYFDFVISNSAFEHVMLSEMCRCFAEVRRILKPNGRFFMRYHPFSSRWGAHCSAYIPVPFVQHFFSERTVLAVWKNLCRARILEGRDLHHDLKYVDQMHRYSDHSGLNCASTRLVEQEIGKAGFRIASRRPSNRGFSRWLAKGPLFDVFADNAVYVLD